ncbi:hypothetical protein CGRA01v4_08922 [Colletotrichum graminicola]|uniref:2EXR domain-containing protein n=1 Tax=Colletotrichum graminicola (strain M1.001 / M2 / FGSC 10212) TaxID=645133 RepID=E3Q7H0_COLGM|nr:uncharacterized protein GLRG_02628 [Colletotrichum graminicola M1.001]EFQ26808.1 hypothetical protein GLRG_02628 [Colletotrichum graminicola M1.001]WDK17639.1 hypothetical protein CGRA01v4_08922 [Colletotrichum graminicola]
MFIHYKKLPPEIRAAIWKLAFGGGRIVSTEALRHTPPAAALANRESWAEYTKLEFMVTPGGGRVYFDPEIDIVVYSRLTDYPPCQGEPRLQNDIHREYRGHVAKTSGSGRMQPPLLPQPIANPHPGLRTAMMVTETSYSEGHTLMTWDPLTRTLKDLIENHKRDPIMKLPKILIKIFPNLRTLWRAGSCPWSCQYARDPSTAGWHLKFVQFRYYSASQRVMIRDMPKPARREFWRIQRHVTQSRIEQPSAYRVVAAIDIIRERDIAPADMTDGWRIVRTFEEETAGGQDKLQYDLLPDRLWWMILGGEIDRYIG